MLDAKLYMAVRCGDYDWICCLPPDRIEELRQLFTTLDNEELGAILHFCKCKNAPPPPLGLPTVNPPVPAPPGPTVTGLTAAIGAMELPDVCITLKDYICSRIVKVIVKTLCAAVAPVNDTLQNDAPADKKGRGLIALINFLCKLYDIACEDERAAAAFVLGWCSIGDLATRSLVDLTNFGGATPAIAFFLNDILTRMQQAAAQTDCCPALLTANPQLTSMMQNIVTGG